MARHDECEWNCGGTDCTAPTRYVPSEDAEKEVLEKSDKRKRSLVQRFVMWCRSLLWWHKWDYYNPYNRECKVCGRHEIKYCDADDWYRDWWEEMDGGDISKHTT